MPFRELPAQAQHILQHHEAAPRLIAHLTVVHDVAYTLLQLLQKIWPDLPYDREAVLMGAALHDIGKVVHPTELTGSGSKHEEVGPQLLLADDALAPYARFARTHARWSSEPDIRLEDLLVAFTDKIWKGQRDPQLEQELASLIAAHTHQEPWEIFMQLDDVANTLAHDAHERILWQSQTN